MKKIFFLAATAALALSSCSSDENDVLAPEQGGDLAVGFDTYLMRSGRSTAITTTASVKTGGFGVFAYDHAQHPVETYTNSYIAPNFFNNEKVTYKAWKDGADERWGYANIKYWPNNPGNMLSFYAYAPYDENLSTKYGESNPRLILNGDYNGPALYYKLPDNLSEGVDLCWGEEYGLDKAPINKTKPGISEDVKFNLKHALARYGFNIQVWSDNMTDYYPDETKHDPTGEWNNGITASTTIKINSLKLVGNFCTEGILSLYDGTWDADIANTAEYELYSQIDSDIKENGITGDKAKEEIPLFADANEYVMLLPESRFKILIDYDVVTKDPNLLVTQESRTNNVILSDEEFIAQSGVATDFHLNLGMTTVKFDAVVTDWNNADKEEVDLPANSLELVAYTALPTYGSLPQYITEKFLGRSSSVMKTSAAGQYYYDTTKETLFVSDANNGWTEAPQAGFFLANTLIYEYSEVAENRSAWFGKTAPRWIKVANAADKVYLLNNTNEGYTEITVDETTYKDKNVADLVQDNPTTGFYLLSGGNYYYYVKQPTQGQETVQKRNTEALNNGGNILE